MKFQAYGIKDIDQIQQLRRLSEADRFAIKVVANVLPFRVNTYVIEQLIDWNNIPLDPIYQISFPQPGMLSSRHFHEFATLLKENAPSDQRRATAAKIHKELNPHPAGQQTLNVPKLDARPIEGVQHKYRETVLFFPRQGQSCFTYCTFCFRWPQFVREKELRIAASNSDALYAYLQSQPEVTDLLVTGGDPLVMKTSLLARYLTPLLREEFSHIQNIRIGTKALSYWPFRFLTDGDADDLLRLFETVVEKGRQLALMVHFNHWQELETEPVQKAISRLRSAGVILRSQSPILAHVNDAPDVWRIMWQKQLQLGIIPYYMFAVRDTGARNYFEIPLVKCWEIYRQALRQVSGLARTVRGPSMSCGPGKIELQGIAEVMGQKVMVLRFIQGRKSTWVQQPFFAEYNPDATWLDHLRPAFGEEKFFFEDEYNAMLSR